MLRSLAAVTGLCLAGLAGAPNRTALAAPRGGGGDEDAILVSFKSDASPAARFGALERESLDVDDATSPHFVRVRVGGRAKGRGHTRRSVLAALRRNAAVRYAEPDYPVHALLTPDDTFFGQLWGLNNTGQAGGVADADIDAPEAWNVSTGSDTTVVAVVDTGVDYNHPDLTDNILRDAQGNVVGYDYYNNDALPMDDNGHGSHCAGTIGARGNNGLGVAGVCHRVKIMPLKFLGSSGSGSTSNAIKALDYATTHGAKVISNSWGGSGASEALSDAMKRARDAGVLVVCAAGNESNDNDASPTYPANYSEVWDNVLSVAATDSGDNLAGFSNYGAQTVDLAAPGVGIYSTYMTAGGSYRTLSGTSMATPHVAGAAALVLAQFPQIGLAGLKARLLGAVDHPVGIAGKVRTGRLNVAKALITDTNPPGAPTGLTVTHRSADAFIVAWIASGDDGAVGTADFYELRYSTTPVNDANWSTATPAPGLPAPLVSGSGQSALVMGLTPGASYYFGLRAYDKVGNPSPAAAFGPAQTLTVATPVTTLSDDAEGVAQFTGDVPWARTIEAASSPTHSYTDSVGGPYENFAETSLTQTTPVALLGYSPTLQFRLRHDLEDGYDLLFVEVSSDLGGTWEQVGSYTGTNLAWQTQSLSLGRFYGRNVQVRFRLSADFSIAGDGAWVDDIRITGGQLLALNGPWPPPAPTGFNANPTSQTAVQLTWGDAGPDETGLRLERKRATDLLYSPLVDLPANSTGYADNSAVADTAYNYRLTPYNAVGDGPTVFASASTPPYAPNAPTGLSATPGDTQVTLVWSPTSGATSYNVYRGTASGGPYSAVKTGQTTAAWLDAGVTNGIRYYYVVKAANAGGESGASEEADALPAAQPPSPPTNVAAKRKSFTRARVEWIQSPSPGVTKNRVYQATGPTGPWTRIAEIAATTSYTATGLKKKSSYYYHVTAVNAAGLESAKSNSAFVSTKGKK